MTKNTLSFGTDGIRGNAGLFPFTSETLFTLGRAIGRWSRSLPEHTKRRCLIIYDTRASCTRIKNHLAQGLSEEAISCIDGGILPTPAAALLVSQTGTFDFGIIISASHNPASDNGIKFTSLSGHKISADDEREIVSHFTRLRSAEKSAPSTQAQPLTPASIYKDTYIEKVLCYFAKNLLNGLTVVLDCSHGATFDVAPRIFRELGAIVHTIGTSPNGKNINKQCGSLYPQKLANAVRQHNANLGIAFDGDGDRALLVTSDGTIKDGDDILALLLMHQRYKNTPAVVGTIMSNHGLSNYLSTQEKKLIRTRVGDKHIAKKLLEEKLLIGGETSGHILMTDYPGGGDGIFTALRCLESIIEHENWTLSTFKKYPQVKINIPIDEKKDLKQSPCSDLINSYTAKLSEGRIIVRYSGTEKLLRIMTEDANKQQACSIASELAQKLKSLLATKTATLITS